MEREPIGVDCNGQKIIPSGFTLSVHTNRHPNTDGSRWGWIEGCTSNICWSDNKAFNSGAAHNLVKEFNEKKTTERRKILNPPLEIKDCQEVLSREIIIASQRAKDGTIKRFTFKPWENEYTVWKGTERFAGGQALEELLDDFNLL